FPYTTLFRSGLRGEELGLALVGLHERTALGDLLDGDELGVGVDLGRDVVRALLRRQPVEGLDRLPVDVDDEAELLVRGLVGLLAVGLRDRDGDPLGARGPRGHLVPAEGRLRRAGELLAARAGLPVAVVGTDPHDVAVAAA